MTIDPKILSKLIYHYEMINTQELAIKTASQEADFHRRTIGAILSKLQDDRSDFLSEVIAFKGYVLDFQGKTVHFVKPRKAAETDIMAREKEVKKVKDAFVQYLTKSWADTNWGTNQIELKAQEMVDLIYNEEE